MSTVINLLLKLEERSVSCFSRHWLHLLGLRLFFIISLCLHIRYHIIVTCDKKCDTCWMTYSTTALHFWSITVTKIWHCSQAAKLSFVLSEMPSCAGLAVCKIYIPGEHLWCPLAMACWEGVWGHAPPGNFESYTSNGAIWDTWV